MDRISPSEGGGAGSIPAGDTQGKGRGRSHLPPKEKIEVQFLTRARLRARFKGRWFLTRAGDPATRLARAKNKTAITRRFVFPESFVPLFSLSGRYWQRLID